MVGLLVLLPCAGVSLARAASREPSVTAGAAGRALPRQFTVEVGPGGSFFVDGTPVRGFADIGRWAQRAVQAASFSGAVVFGDPARDGALLQQAVEALRQAGFADVRSAGRPAPTALSALRATGAPLAAARPAAAPRAVGTPARATPPAVKTPSAPKAAPVALSTVGLHVGGPLNREPHRTRLVRLFERQFAAFQRCHARAERHAQGASYGVDLLVPKGGGRPKVKETRTRLAGKGFSSCMNGAFEAIRFAPPPTERDEIVSYSVLFKPPAR